TFDISSATLGLPVSFSTPKSAISSVGIQVASKLIIIGPLTRLLAYPSYCASIHVPVAGSYDSFCVLKSSLPWKYTAMVQSPPSSHLSSWTCVAGCDHTDPAPPVCGAAPSKVCVNLPWITTPSYAAVCQCQPES